MSALVAIGRWFARFLLGEYSAYFIYEREAAWGLPAASLPAHTMSVRLVDGATIRASSDSMIREQAHYAGEGSHAFACFHGDRIAGVCFYWFGERYRSRNYWPLGDREAKLVQIISVPELRGKGSASVLIVESFRLMAANGYAKAYARIWHSNTPSLRAFERAGWRRRALVIEINPFRQRRPMRLQFALRPSNG